MNKQHALGGNTAKGMLFPAPS